MNGEDKSGDSDDIERDGVDTNNSEGKHVHESQNLIKCTPLPLFIRVREKEEGQYILVCFVIHHQIIYQIVNIWKSRWLKLQNKNFKI